MCSKLCPSCVCALVLCGEFIMCFGANSAEWENNNMKKELLCDISVLWTCFT